MGNAIDFSFFDEENDTEYVDFDIEEKKKKLAGSMKKKFDFCEERMSCFSLMMEQCLEKAEFFMSKDDESKAMEWMRRKYDYQQQIESLKEKKNEIEKEMEKIRCIGQTDEVHNFGKLLEGTGTLNDDERKKKVVENFDDFDENYHKNLEEEKKNIEMKKVEERERIIGEEINKLRKKYNLSREKTSEND